jgi:hypothetical protein
LSGLFFLAASSLIRTLSVSARGYAFQHIGSRNHPRI